MNIRLRGESASRQRRPVIESLGQRPRFEIVQKLPERWRRDSRTTTNELFESRFQRFVLDSDSHSWGRCPRLPL